MPITGIIKKTRLKNKYSPLPFRLALSITLLLLLGCAHKNDLMQAQDYSQKSRSYYVSASKEYQALIKQERNLSQLYFELGRLYYSHGDFEQAIAALRKTDDARGKKLLGTCYYRLGNFTDALDIFDKNKDKADDEFLYYYALTSEKLNLFDQAVGLYRKIRANEFSGLALGHINTIEKQTRPAHIKDISPQAYRVLSQDYSIHQYPQAGALILYCDEKIEITPQDTQEASLHYIIKILNERGKEEFAETGIDYDSTYEKVELEYARTIKPDGTVINVGKRHIRDVSKYLNFPLYSNARVYIISFPEIIEGASIEYKLKIQRNQLVNKKDFSFSYPIQASQPVISAGFQVVLPKGRKLKLKTINTKYNNFRARLKPDFKETGGRIVYSWKFKDIPQIIPEANMPPAVEINPTLLLSTFDNWQDVYAWWWGLAEGKIKTEETIKEQVQKLVKGLGSDEERMRAIYNFCAQKIRYVAVEYGQAGYEPHPAADILKNKYGDCKDQAILLITMLREAGFQAYPVLIPTKECYNLRPDFPALLFNHCIAAVFLKDRIVFLDPTAETCPFADLPAGDQDRRALVLEDNGYQIKELPLYPAGHNLLKNRLDIKIDNLEAILAHKVVFTRGLYDQAQRYWLLYTEPELIEEDLKENIQHVSIGARLIRYKIENVNNLNKPIVLSYAFGGPEYLTIAGNFRILPQLVTTDASLVAKEQRRYAIDFSVLDSKESIFEIEIPGTFAVKYMPEDVAEDSPWLKFTAKYEFRNNKICFRQNTELKKNVIPEAEYRDFKKFYKNLAKRIKQRVILEKVR